MIQGKIHLNSITAIMDCLNATTAHFNGAFANGVDSGSSTTQSTYIYTIHTKGKVGLDLR